MRFKAALFHFIVILAAAFSASAAMAQERTLQLVGLGDSLMAGYQLPPTDGYTAQLEAALKAKGINVTVTNAGVSGDTSSGGLARAEWSVPDGTDGVILELGANDALRGIAPEQTEKNLDAIISGFQKRNIAVLLVGIMAPPNMGDDYAKRFNPIYPKLAEKYNLPLYPFFLDGVVTDDKLKLEDKMHPNTQGVAMMVEKSLPAVESFIKTIGAQKISTCARLHCMIRYACSAKRFGELAMPRLFIALEIPRNAAMSLSLLRGGLPGARWIDVENYHITLRFIGDIDGRTADEVVDRLDRIDRPEFQLSLNGMGSFGSKKPHSIWAGVSPRRK